MARVLRKFTPSVTVGNAGSLQPVPKMSCAGSLKITNDPPRGSRSSPSSSQDQSRWKSCPRRRSPRRSAPGALPRQPPAAAPGAGRSSTRPLPPCRRGGGETPGRRRRPRRPPGRGRGRSPHAPAAGQRTPRRDGLSDPAPQGDVEAGQQDAPALERRCARPSRASTVLPLPRAGRRTQSAGPPTSCAAPPPVPRSAGRSPGCPAPVSRRTSARAASAGAGHSCGTAGTSRSSRTRGGRRPLPQ